MSSRESYSDRFACHLRAGDLVRPALVAAREFGDAQILTKDQLARLCIVVEELLTNLRDHGRLSDEAVVQLHLAREPAGIRITLVDPGKPFDPRSASSNGKRPDRGGGVGIEIIRAWAKFIDYQASPEGNRLELLLGL